jgi:hypothetical protein
MATLMDQRKLLVLIAVSAALLGGCATPQRFVPLQGYDVDGTRPGKTTNFQPVEIDIAAGEVSSSINEWARQTDMDVLFSPDDLRGICAPPLKGLFYPADALRQLLEGIGLTFSEPVIGEFVVIPITPEWVQTQPRDVWRGDDSAIEASTSAGQQLTLLRTDRNRSAGCLPSTYARL